MARKSDTGFVEQHIEKIVLAICALLLVLVFVRWVVSSPQEVKVLSGAGYTTETVPPDQADKKLAEAAEAIRARHDPGDAPNVPKINWVKQIEQAGENPFPALPPMLDLGMVPPEIKPPPRPDPNSMPSLDIVVALIPAPGKPAGWVGFECPEPLPDKQPEDLIVYRGASVYPWGRLEKNWRQKLNTLRVVNVVVLGVEVEVQSRLPDQLWSETKPGEPANVVRLPRRDEQGNPLVVPKIPEYDGANAEEVRTAIDEIRQNWQWYFLTPPYHNVLHPSAGYIHWTIHMPDNEVSRTLEPGLLPTETLQPELPPTPAPTRAPTWSEPSRRTPPRRVPTPPRRVPTPPRIPRGRPITEGEFPPEGELFPEDPRRRPGTRYPRPTPRPDVRPDARPAADVPVPLGAEITAIPDLAKQMEDGKVLIIFHDNSLKLGRFYRYRVRVVLLNPLLTFDDLVRDPARDARTKKVRTPWSEWSDEVIVEDPTTFFLTGELPDQVQVTVFTRKLGQTVMKTFRVRPGMVIGRPSRVTLSSPGAEAAAVEVDFSTGAVAVELDFDRTFQKDAPGMMTISTKTVAMLYLNRKGELKTRIMAADMQSERYKKQREEARLGGDQ